MDATTNVGQATGSYKCIGTSATNAQFCFATYCVKAGKCVLLTNTDPTRYGTKDTGVCIGLDVATAIACAPGGDICLDTADDKCKLLGWNYTTDNPNAYPTIYGTEKTTLHCLKLGDSSTIGILKCRWWYCITSPSPYKCQILSVAASRYGRDASNHNCITASSTQLASIDCCDNLYCVANVILCPSAKYVCRLMTLDTALAAFGKHLSTHVCL